MPLCIGAFSYRLLSAIGDVFLMTPVEGSHAQTACSSCPRLPLLGLVQSPPKDSQTGFLERCP